MTATLVITSFNGLTDTPALSVTKYGANGDGATDDTAAILATIAAAGIGGTIYFPPRTYLISGTLQLLAGQRVIGNGATIKRANQVTTTTTTPITAGSTTEVTLASVAGFREGMCVAFAQGGVAQPDLVAFTTLDTTNREILNIQGNVITLSGAPNATLAAGANCYLSFISVHTADDCRVEDLRFDGNRANWPWSRWEVVNEILCIGNRVQITGCYINNAAGEGIISENGNGQVIRNNNLSNLTGNGIHFGGVGGNQLGVGGGGDGTLVDGNSVINANLETVNGSIGHQDGCIIWSSYDVDVTCVNNYCEAGISGFGSIDSSDNSDITLADNTIRNCTSYGIEMVNTTLDNYAKRIIVIGNRIYNCGAVDGGGMTVFCLGSADQVKNILIADNYFDTGGLAITSQNSAGLPPDRISVTNNRFVGCGIVTLVAEGLTIRSNQIDRTGDTTTGHYGIYNQSSVTNCVFDGNEIRGGDQSIFFATTATDVIVSGNQCLSPGSSGITLTGAGLRVTLRDNRIDKTGDTTTGHYGLNIASTLTSSVIADNTIIGGDQNVNFGSTATDVDFSGNQCSASGTNSIHVRAATRLVMRANSIDKSADAVAGTGHICILLGGTTSQCRLVDNKTIGGDYGISGGAITDTTLSRNMLLTPGTSGINLSGAITSSLIEHNHIDKTGDTTHAAVNLNALVRTDVVGNKVIGGSTAINCSTTGCSNSRIAQNNCYGQFGAGIALSGNAAAPGCTIESNTIQNAAGCSANWLGINCGAQQVRVHANNVTNFGTSANAIYGILVTNAGPDYIDSNLVRGAWAGGSIFVNAGNTGSLVQNNMTTAALVDNGLSTVKANNQVIT